MSVCVGVDNKACGVEFNDPQYPNDTLCDECSTCAKSDFKWSNDKNDLICQSCGKESELQL